MSSPTWSSREADNLQYERNTLDLGITKITRSLSGEEIIWDKCDFLLPTPIKADGTEAGNEDLATLTIDVKRHER